MVLELGSPLSSGPAADQEEPKNFIWHDYGKISGDLAGRLGIIVDKRTDRIDSISIAPDSLTMEQAIEYFGEGYQITGYRFCDGYENETDGPVYEDPTASELRNIEYRSRGISIAVGFQDRVNEITVVAKPMGLSSKKVCERSTRSKRK